MYEDFSDWLVYDKRLSPTTALIYTRRLRQAADQLGFDPRNHNAFQTWMWVRERGGSPSNQDSWVGALQKYQEYLASKGEDPHFADELKLAKRPKRLPKPLAENDIQKVIEAVDIENLWGARDRAILEMLYCGLRNAEVCNSKLQMYNNREVTLIGKGNKERIVPINELAWEAVLRWALWYHGGVTTEPGQEGLDNAFAVLKQSLVAEPERLMFVTTEGNWLDPRRVRDIVSSAAKRAGLDGQHVHPHRFRHSFATHVLDHGATDLLALRKVMGHEDLRTTGLYVDVSKAGRNRIVAFHPRQK